MAVCSKLDGVSCHVLGHTWSPHCFDATFGIFKSIFKQSFKIYSTVYVASSLLSGRKLTYYKKKILLDILRSTFFLSVNGSAFVFFFCMLRKIFGTFYYVNCGFSPALLASFLAILFERDSRRSVLALYMSTLAVEAAFNLMKSRGIVTTVPHGEVILFSIGTAFMMLMYHHPGMESGPLKRLLSFLLKPKTLSQATGSGISQLTNGLKVTVRAAGIGYVISALSRLLFSLKKTLRNPGTVWSVFTHRENVDLAAFLGSFVALNKITFNLLSQSKFFSSEKWKAFLAGGVSGLSMLFYPSSSIALYLLSKLVELYYKFGVQQGVLPSIPYADVLVYAFSTGLVLHVGALEPHNMRLSYWKFLNQITNKRFCEFNRKLFQEHFGGDSAKLFPEGDLYMSLRL